MAITRRAFLQGGVLFLAGTASGEWLAGQTRPAATIGLVTDIHHADKEAAGTRYYRRSLAKLGEEFRQLGRENVDRVVHLGDLVDAMPDVALEELAIRDVAAEFEGFGKPRHFVMGNHCLSGVDKRRFAELTGTAGACELFDVGGVRIVCLDACFRADGAAYAAGNFDWTDTSIPPSQVTWLEAALQKAPGPCVVLVHQLLEPVPSYRIANHAEVRSVIAGAGNVIAVLQGHYHQNRYTEIDGVPYIVLRSTIDGPRVSDRGSAVLSVFENGSASLKGYGQQHSYRLRRAAAGGVLSVEC